MRNCIFCFFLCVALLVSCTASGDGDYSYTEDHDDTGDYSYTEDHDNTGYDPLSKEIVHAPSLYHMKQLYIAAGKGTAVFEEYLEEVSEGLGRIRVRFKSRDKFLTAYFDLAEYSMLVPTENSEFQISGIDINRRKFGEYWKNERQYIYIGTDYANISEEDGFYVSSAPSDGVNYAIETGLWEACGEVYYGKDFQAYVYKIDDEPYRIYWRNKQGELMGRIGGGFNTVKDAEDYMQYLDNLKAVTFHKAVQSAKEPK